VTIAIVKMANGAMATPIQSARYAAMTADDSQAPAAAAPASTPMSGIRRESLSFRPETSMFLGHFGVGLGAKRAAPSVSLGTLFIAGQFADLLWPSLVLLGYERVEIQPGATRVAPLNFVSYPYSHSLLALCTWGAAFGAAYLVIRRARIAAAVTIVLAVVSHWALDYVTHRPDMPLTLQGPARLGLGLWNSLPGTLAAEAAVFGIGLALYLRDTTARDRVGSVGLWSLVAFLVIVYAASVFGPPPPRASAVAWSAQAMWLIVVWGYWVDRHRRPHRNRLGGLGARR
jgi:membrane-bound metal-dependent hydrolase YbcI (DUF457 family)